MARPSRIEMPGGLYHVMSRGHHGGPIYEDEQDRTTCLELVAQAVERYDWRCYAYCQMTDHYHLVFRTIKANLSAGMRFLNGVYTQAVNRRRSRIGPVFQGRYKTVLIDPVHYFLPICRYIVLNPVRAGLVPSPGDWPWSSYRATAGDEPVPSWLSADSLLEHLAGDRAEARSRYREYVHEGIGECDLWKHIRGQRYLGDEEFVTRMQAACDPKSHRGDPGTRPPAPSLDEIAASAGSRNEALVEAYRTGAYSYADLARHFGLHPGSIGRIINAGRKPPNDSGRPGSPKRTGSPAALSTAAFNGRGSEARQRRRITLGSLGAAAVVLVIPLMHGGLVTATLPVLTGLVAVAFLAESRRFLFEERGAWREAAPWVYVWLGVSLYIFGQPAARELFGLSLTINDIEFTRVYWLQHVKYWSFFTAYWLLAWVVSRQHGRARELIVIAVIAMALFQSLYGTMALVRGQETILGIWPKTNSVGSVSGTFYNRNHLAGFLAVAMTLGAAYIMSGRWTLNIQRAQFIKLFVTIMFLLIAGAALIGTASRLGIFAALIGLFLWAWLHTRAQQAPTRLGYIWAGALVALPLLAGLWFGPQHLIERLFQLDESTARPVIWRTMLDVPVSVWVQGVGAGGFHDVFKLIQPVDHSRSVWRAHSEYLQLVFELGLIGIALLTPLVIHWIRRCRPAELGSLQRGALAGIVAILIHNIADFDMQIPGTAVVFWIAVGILFSGTANNQKPSG